MTFDTGNNYFNINWNYAMGYHFTPKVNGTIDELGGLFNGVKQVKLFRKDTGQLLAQTSIVNNNDWKYGSVSAVSVQAGVTYTVAVYLAGAGGVLNSPHYESYFPLDTNNIVINGSTYISTLNNSNAIPTNTVTTFMYGMADVHFVPN